MKKLFKLLFVLTLLSSCSSKEKQTAGELVAKLWDAQSSTVGSSSSADTKNGTRKSFILTLENLKGIKADYPNENITSISAYTFIHNIPAEDYKDYDDIKVIIKNNSSVFEKSYIITDVLLAKEIFDAIDSFSKKVTSGSLNEIDSLIDKQSIPDSTITQIKNTILAIDSAMGKQNKATVIRFDFDHLKETHEPVMIAYVEISNEISYSIYKLILKTLGKKIIYIGINEK